MWKYGWSFFNVASMFFSELCYQFLVFEFYLHKIGDEEDQGSENREPIISQQGKAKRQKEQIGVRGVPDVGIDTFVHPCSFLRENQRDAEKLSHRHLPLYGWASHQQSENEDEQR